MMCLIFILILHLFTTCQKTHQICMKLRLQPAFSRWFGKRTSVRSATGSAYTRATGAARTFGRQTLPDAFLKELSSRRAILSRTTRSQTTGRVEKRNHFTRSIRLPFFCSCPNKKTLAFVVNCFFQYSRISPSENHSLQY